MNQVAGVNYKCKVDVGGDQFCHVTVHQPLLHTKEPAKVSMCSVCGRLMGWDGIWMMWMVTCIGLVN